jgi:hypothetical protein
VGSAGEPCQVAGGEGHEGEGAGEDHAATVAPSAGGVATLAQVQIWQVGLPHRRGLQVGQLPMPLAWLWVSAILGPQVGQLALP